MYRKEVHSTTLLVSTTHWEHPPHLSTTMHSIRLACLLGLFASAWAMFEDELGQRDWMHRTAGGLIQHAVIVGGQLCTTSTHHLACRDLATGDVAWRREIKDIASLQASKSVLFVTDKDKGKSTWKADTGAWLHSTDETPTVSALQDEGNLQKCKVNSNKNEITVGTQSLPRASRVTSVTDDCRYLVLLDETITRVVDATTLEVKWTRYEDLASIQQAVWVDLSHATVSLSDALSWTARLELQVADLTGALQSVWDNAKDIDRREHLFGFYQVAVVRTPQAVSALSARDGTVLYRKEMQVQHLYLQDDNTIVAVSYNTRQAQVECFAAATGATVQSETFELTTPVVQVLPDKGDSSCKMGFLLADQSVVGTATTNSYTHVADASSLTTYRIVDGNRAQVMGRSVWEGTLVAKSYPLGSTSLPNPSHALGDDSLLLKYVNPHVAVVASVVKDGAPADNAVAQALKRKKPVGVGNAPPAEDDVAPNLFVQLVDTVSGVVLHRSSHAHVEPSSVRLLVSEHWVYYTYVNNKTRRPELTVWNMLEGKINRDEMHLWKTPVRPTERSSLESSLRPVVLSKSYSLSTAVTALGITQTTASISNRKVLLALADGRVMTLDRQVLDPRRPVGKLKDAEKKEGLHQYMEYIPTISYAVLYPHPIYDVTLVATTATALESQSLVLVAGLDVLVVRTSPSKGFDLLPESFSRLVLGMVTAGLWLVVWIVQRMAKQKQVREGWV